MAESSTKPYLIRAIYEWCNDNGYTPYVAVAVDSRTQVPREFVKGGEIVLNVSPSATNRLSLGNEMISFQARFSGAARELSFPVDNVSAIYARENGHGMAFDVPKAMAVSESDAGGPVEGPDAPVAGDTVEAPPAASKTSAPGPRAASSGPRAVGPRIAIAPAPATPGRDDGDATRDTNRDVNRDEPSNGKPPEGPPDGSTPRGRPRLTRIK
jgi:stringent starvation protein B